MRIGILTFQETTNYGALLQMVGMYKIISSNNIECEIINYRCDNIVRRELQKPFNSIPFCRMPVEILLRYISKKKYNKMENFKKRQCRISKEKYNRSNIREANMRYDRFIAGSDIIWELNVTGGDTTYYLDFVEDSDKKYAFSSSFGYDEVPEEYIEKTIKLLKDFAIISVREEEGMKIIGKLLEKEVSITVDPTLLLSGDEWRKYEKPYKISVPFVLVYFNDIDGKVMDYAHKLAKEKNLSVVYISNSLIRPSKTKIVRTASVEQFLWLIDHAEYVVTASYHGVLYSVNFNTPFFFYNRTHKGRINTITSTLGLEKRNIVLRDSIDKEIKWEDVNEKLQRLREQSLQRLQEIVS